MKKHIFAALSALTALGLASCDDGKIYPETATLSEGKTVLMEGVLNGLENWTDAYRVSIAGFETADDDYATVSKVITGNDVVDGKVSIELSGIKDGINIVRLCVLDRLRKHIVSFKEIGRAHV